jgi:hypothetical protein
MNKLSMAIAAAAIIGLAGTASAHHQDGHENSADNSAVECLGGGNPGQTFQEVGLAGPDAISNPGQRAKSLPQGNLGQALKELCEVVHPD